VRIYACIALTGALLTVSPVKAETTASEPLPQPIARPDPVKHAQQPAAESTGSFYAYDKAGPVSEHFIRTDAPATAYPSSSPPAYSYYPAPRPGVELEQQGFNGGVGYGGTEGPGGGYGGQAYLYMGQGGGSNEPSNGGGVNLPPGYGPTYRGIWQGPVNPTHGGFGGH
jgi:hypothetical protein